MDMAWVLLVTITQSVTLELPTNKIVKDSLITTQSITSLELKRYTSKEQCNETRATLQGLIKGKNRDKGKSSWQDYKYHCLPAPSP